MRPEIGLCAFGDIRSCNRWRLQLPGPTWITVWTKIAHQHRRSLTVTVSLNTAMTSSSAMAEKPCELNRQF